MLALYLYWRANEFVGHALEEATRPQPDVIEKGIRDDIVEGLSEGNRIVNEALMDEQSEYYDYALFLMLPAAIVCILSIFGFVALLGGPGMQNGLLAIGMGALIAAIMILVPMHFLGKAYKRRTAVLRDWSTRFQKALTREAKGSEDDGDCSLELLIRASEEIPSWLVIGRRSMVHRHPLYSLLILILGVVSLRLLFLAIQQSDVQLMLVTLVGALGCAVSGIIVYQTIRKSDLAGIEQSISDWNSRYAQAKAGMEKMLRDL